MSEKEFNAIFSKRLRYYLSKYDMTQNELAKRLGVGTTSIYNWCNGLKTPRMDKVDAMCSVFNCRRADLIEEPQNPLPFPKIMEYYDRLNDIGKHEATKRVEELTYLPQYTINDVINAAHAISGSSKEDQQHDEDIMDDENF